MSVLIRIQDGAPPPPPSLFCPFPPSLLGMFKRKFARFQMQLRQDQVNEAMLYGDSVVGKDGKVPWQQVAAHFIPRWGLAAPEMDLRSTEGKAVVVRAAEILRTRYRTWKGKFKKEVRAAPKPRVSKRGRSAPAPPVRHSPQVRTHIEKCNELEEVAFQSMLRAAPQHQRPAVPKFSTQAAGFAEQFRIGHFNYWKKSKLTYGQDGTRDDTPKAIRDLYRWQKGHRPYIKPMARGSRAAPALAQVEQIREERRQKEAKQKGKSVHVRRERQGRSPAPALQAMGTPRQRRSNSAPATTTNVGQSIRDALDDLATTVSGTMAHPLNPTPSGTEKWQELCGNTTSARRQIARIGLHPPPPRLKIKNSWYTSRGHRVQNLGHWDTWEASD